jgi:hypothetical protein
MISTTVTLQALQDSQSNTDRALHGPMAQAVIYRIA